MLSLFVLFLVFEAAFLIAAAIYVRIPGTRDRRAPVVMVRPELPRAVAIPAAWRRGRGE